MADTPILAEIDPIAQVEFDLANARVAKLEAQLKLLRQQRPQLPGVDWPDLSSPSLSTSSSSSSPLSPLPRMVLSPVSGIPPFKAPALTSRAATEQIIPLTSPLHPRKRLPPPEPPATPSSTTSTVDSSDDSAVRPAAVRKRIRTHCRLMHTKGTQKIGINQRRCWLLTARGDRTVTVTHQLEHIPPFYHRDIDVDADISTPDDLQLVAKEWENDQPTVRRWMGDVLQHRHQINHQAASASRAQGKRKGKAVEVDDDSTDKDSDWEQELKAARRLGWSPVDPLLLNPGAGWTSRTVMPDILYLELTKSLLADSPEGYLDALGEGNPDLARLIRRQLTEHGRYHLFWAHVNVYSPSADVAAADRRPYSRLEAVRTDSVTLPDCRRCVPMSQLPLLLDSVHSGGSHLKDGYTTLADKYMGITRKAVRLFASKCTVCCRHDKKQRNAAPPRAIIVEEVRQRYTLDLIDMLPWQQLSKKGPGKKNRYVAHMIDHSSKFRWATAIPAKKGELLVDVIRAVFTNFGHPAVLHTDNGGEFVNEPVEQECRQWGTRIIHGRPYHPQSQGVVEIPNGTLKACMNKWRSSNPTRCDDWTFVLSQVVKDINRQVSSVTRKIPEEHFKRFNKMSRQVEPIPDNEPVVISVGQLAKINSLQWVKACEVKPFDWDEEQQVDEGAGQQATEPDEDGPTLSGAGQDEAEATAEEEGEEEEEEGGATEDLPILALFAKPEEDEQGDVDEEEDKPLQSTPLQPPVRSRARVKPTLAMPPPPARQRVTSKERLTASSSEAVDLSRLTILPTGKEGKFVGEEWTSMGPAICQRLRPVGTIANGDCGPASAFFALHGQAATASEAATMRKEVLDHSETSHGVRHWTDHFLNEWEQQPEALELYQAMWRTPQRWVTIDFFTMFGILHQLNVFVLTRGQDKEGNWSTSVRLVTNARRLIKHDRDDCVCIYFQTHLNSRFGHFEGVVDDEGRHRWAAEEDTIQQCLFRAMQQTRMARGVVDMRTKMLIAANNRGVRNNEQLEVGDVAWLTLPKEIVAVTRAKVPHQAEFVDEGVMLVKIGRIHEESAKPGVSPFTTQPFVLFTQWGRIPQSYSINQLKLADPPPEAREYGVVGFEVPTKEMEGKRKPLTLLRHFRRYLMERLRHQLAAQEIKRLATTEAAASISAAAQVAHGIVAAINSSPPALPDDMIFPCTHCHETLPAADLTHCMFADCRAPFHTPGAGCRQAHRVEVVNEVLLYCSTACGRKDSGLGQPLRALRKKNG